MAEKRSKASERVRTVVFMLIVTLVSISILSSLYVAAAERVARNERLFTRRAVLEAAGIPVPAAAEDAMAIYDRCVTAMPSETNVAYYAVGPTNNGTAGRSAGLAQALHSLVRAPDRPEVRACVFPASGSGLWGQIDALVGLDEALRSVTGITFIRQSETPGLGARIEEPWFKKQFVGKMGPFTVVPEGTKSPAVDRFDGITGATITTLAVRDLLNTTLSNAPSRIAAAPR